MREPNYGLLMGIGCTLTSAAIVYGGMVRWLVNF